MEEVADEQSASRCPWFWMAKFDTGEAKGEPFFGSDRFHFMWEHLELPWDEVKLLSKDAKAHLGVEAWSVEWTRRFEAGTEFQGWMWS